MVQVSAMLESAGIDAVELSGGTSLVKSWQEGDIKRASCISCNKCFIPTRAGKGIYCVIENQR